MSHVTYHTSHATRQICIGRNMSLAVFNVSPDGRMSAITQGMRLGANLKSGEQKAPTHARTHADPKSQTPKPKPQTPHTNR